MRLAHLLSGGSAAVAVLCTLLMAAPAAAQVNYKPLDRGDYTVEPLTINVARGLNVEGHYALDIRVLRNDGLPGSEKETDVQQDFRLHLSTLFHQDVAMHLVLAPGSGDFQEADLRTTDSQTANGQFDAQPTGITAREVYLRYLFNPRSAITLGKHEVSLGDRRGKVYEGIAPAATFDCELGTWCMPFGLVRTGQQSADWMYHWALRYTAWQEPVPNTAYSNKLSVEIFRIIYTEQNVPLSENLGPGRYDAATPTVAAAGQIADDDGNGIFYDAHHQNYLGVTVNWEQDSFFFNFDAVSNQGIRRYHLYRQPSGGGIVGEPEYGDFHPGWTRRETLHGLAMESEFGWRLPESRLGFRLLNATGDEERSDDNGNSYLRGLNGFHEITPGSYRGSRLYFNGGSSDPTAGAGLGHSISGVQMAGFFWDYDSPERRKFGYSLGLYSLQRTASIWDEDGERQSNIGVEWDNLFTWHVHPALKVQVEGNLLQPGGAFSYSDTVAPDPDQKLFLQGIARLLYTF